VSDVTPVSGQREEPSISALGEDRLIRSLLARLGAPVPRLRVGPGDDAAVLGGLTGTVVVSTDTLVEEQDFRRDWSTAQEVGTKLVAQNLADIAAMGARPVALLVSLAAPGWLPVSWAEDLATGLDDECRRAGAGVVGGDVSEADRIVLTGTALGVLEGVEPVLRSGARPGDTVALCGRTGRSAAGLALLVGRGRTGAALPAEADRLVGDHCAPRPPYPAGPLAAGAGAGALIDTSDGLVRDATRIAVASGVVLDLDPAALVPSADLVRVAELLGTPELAREWVLTGGEDHALLGCFPAGTALPVGFRPVGSVRVAGSAGPGVLVGGRVWQGHGGWEHYRVAAGTPAGVGGFAGVGGPATAGTADGQVGTPAVADGSRPR
jgi:thiamine-monophosphate kinase